jgi:hypothetical protein
MSDVRSLWTPLIHSLIPFRWINKAPFTSEEKYVIPDHELLMARIWVVSPADPSSSSSSSSQQQLSFSMTRHWWYPVSMAIQSVDIVKKKEIDVGRRLNLLVSLALELCFDVHNSEELSSSVKVWRDAAFTIVYGLMCMFLKYECTSITVSNSWRGPLLLAVAQKSFLLDRKDDRIIKIQHLIQVFSLGSPRHQRFIDVHFHICAQKKQNHLLSRFSDWWNQQSALPIHQRLSELFKLPDWIQKSTPLVDVDQRLVLVNKTQEHEAVRLSLLSPPSSSLILILISVFCLSAFLNPTFN